MYRRHHHCVLLFDLLNCRSNSENQNLKKSTVVGNLCFLISAKTNFKIEAKGGPASQEMFLPTY